MGIFGWIREAVRNWIRANDVLIATAVTGFLTILCLFIVPIYGFGPGFLSPEEQGLIAIRSASSLFIIVFGIGLASMVLFLLFALELLLPDEWMSPDAD